MGQWLGGWLGVEGEVNAVRKGKLMLSQPNLGEVKVGAKIGNFLITEN